MTDKQMVAAWKRITDPVKALEKIVENEGYMGYDPYYATIRGALIEMAERIVAASKEKK